MFGLHMPELIIILVVALLIFGPKKLPEMGSAIGKSIKEFRKGMNEMAQPKEEEEKQLPKPVEPETTSSASSGAAYSPPANSEVASSEAGKPEIPVE